MKRRAGHLYLRGTVWWMKYYVAGRPVYESTGQQKESQAQRVLNERIGKVATGQTILPRLDRITYAEAAKDLREHYTSSGDRDVTGASSTAGVSASSALRVDAARSIVSAPLPRRPRSAS